MADKFNLTQDEEKYEAMIRDEAKKELICELVSKNLLPIETALSQLNITQEELYTSMKKFGYMV